MKDKITDKMIEEKLARAIDESAPDMLDSLMSELGITDESPEMLRDAVLASDAETSGKETEDKDAKKWEPVTARKENKQSVNRFRKYIIACAALFLIVGGFSLFGGGDGAKETFAVIGLDVNPSIEISIDSAEKVIRADALNNDGKTVLDGMSLGGTDVKVACNAILGSMLAKGYLTDTQNSVLVSVRASDAGKGKQIESEIAGNLNSFLENSEITGAILGQLVEDDDELEDFAEAHGISLGKAWLIRNLLASGDKHMTEESLLMLSTQELILLGQEKHIHDENSYGNADTSQYIGSDKAIEIALGAAGVEKSQAKNISAEFDAENGMIVYEVEFTANGVEYEYNISATKGTVISYGSDVDHDGDHDEDDDDDHDDDHDDDDHDDDHDNDD